MKKNRVVVVNYDEWLMLTRYRVRRRRQYRWHTRINRIKAVISNHFFYSKKIGFARAFALVFEVVSVYGLVNVPCSSIEDGELRGALLLLAVMCAVLLAMPRENLSIN